MSLTPQPGPDANRRELIAICGANAESREVVPRRQFSNFSQATPKRCVLRKPTSFNRDPRESET